MFVTTYSGNTELRNDSGFMEIIDVKVGSTKTDGLSVRSVHIYG